MAECQSARSQWVLWIWNSFCYGSKIGRGDEVNFEVAHGIIGIFLDADMAGLKPARYTLHR